MDLSRLSILMEELAKWRLTEAAAEQDVRDAELFAIAADQRLGKAREAQRHVTSQVTRIQCELSMVMNDATAPRPDVFGPAE